VTRVLPGSGGSGAPWACCCAAEITSNLLDALPKQIVYPRLGGPHSKSGLPAIHVKRQRRHSHFCLEALYWYSLVGSSNGSEALVFGFL
jgi:hypothetical protein